MSDLVQDWLRLKRVQLWGPGYDLTDEKELAIAAEWFAAELRSFEQHLMRDLVKWDVEAVIYPERHLPPPAKGTHESELTLHAGPLIPDGNGGFLPGTDVDESYDRAYDWSRS